MRRDSIEVSGLGPSEAWEEEKAYLSIILSRADIRKHYIRSSNQKLQGTSKQGV
jgi:hypothetical protein